MFTKTAVAVLAAAGAAAAAPTATPNTFFGGIAIHSGSAIHNSGISADSGKLWISHAQNASCDAGNKQDFATFSIGEDGSAYLYTNGAPYQQLWVDRSGMGRGNIGYTTGAQPAPKNAERTGFAVNADGHLTFGGSDGFYACGSAEAGYAIWQQKFDDTCLPFAFRAQYTETPVGCWYSESS
ncbi:hypothetical protein B0J12DRAFT_694050 [Macrophomina phaseolina]|uniref:Cell wall mannoprotein PIR1-like C-terminal domain-containing protein n=1 Tax=Macrophomina phaseolina TaxID=35725 RepID=A0ABQ8GRJ8_9PEZI|nr:hypothetical protein B0J12DRAFT_694050 [Macrophomina phaseolina]